jgi:sulfur carrier protein ThiS
VQITIDIAGKNETKILELDEPATPLDVLNAIDQYPDGVIVISKRHSDRPVPIDTILISGDRLKIIPVASGG